MSIETMVKRIRRMATEECLPRRMVTPFVYRSVEAKRRANALLGLAEENDYRLFIPQAEEDDLPDLSYAYPTVYALTKEIVNQHIVRRAKDQSAGTSLFQPRVSLQENLARWVVSRGEGPCVNYAAKLTRVLSSEMKFATKQGSSVKHWLEQAAFGAGYEEAALRVAAYELGLSSENDLERAFLPKIGELAIKSGRCLVLSTNPSDFLTASYNASFSSCYSPDGCAFNSTLAFSLSPQVVIGFLCYEGRPEYKLGRTWLWFDEQHRMVANQPRYGGLTREGAYTLRQTIQERIDREHPCNEGWVSKWYKTGNIRVAGSGVGIDAAYWDGMETVSYRRDILEGFDKTERPSDFSCMVSAAYCLCCGRSITSKRNGGVCSDCIGGYKICQRCGATFFKDSYDVVYNDEKLICPTCVVKEYDRLYDNQLLIAQQAKTQRFWRRLATGRGGL